MHVHVACDIVYMFGAVPVPTYLRGVPRHLPLHPPLSGYGPDIARLLYSCTHVYDTCMRARVCTYVRMYVYVCLLALPLWIAFAASFFI